MESDIVQAFPAYRLVAEFTDGARLTFDGGTEEEAQAAMEHAQDLHGEIFWWDGVTDALYEKGRLYKLVPRRTLSIFGIDLTEKSQE